MEISIDIRNKSFAKGQRVMTVLDDIHLDIDNGEFITIIGPSGCGKSTLLKIIAGLDSDYEGSVQIGKRAVNRPGIEQGFVFQEHRLFPWLTVEENIAGNLPLKKAAIRKKVDELIDIVRLRGFAKAYPKELSGGMSQRVAIARALLRKPGVLLLDEPFGALDAFTRRHLQEVLLQIWLETETTMILVTHDLDESVYLGNRVVVMGTHPGRIQRLIRIDLPFPRQRTHPSFQKIRQNVLQEFESADEFSLVRQQNQ
ncbi:MULTISPECIES: ABC transporter ATP-binding protein [unclassified Sporolactobacillus]|uniref:ABC transporter ATP-binding protein n=1 Tax=unclassified Sporolactobacillus TaxID=2628533 RepID=UPI0023682C7F|nr:ABC transporter ATP-binding protein [Sporolactobacillus sp. CQH2019]MDD9148289.1 ABC transporter ATP-binding protein [Sporolactobacillus sp. CQH2019]